MPRTLDADLLAAMNSGSFTPWFQLQLMDVDRSTVMFETTDVLGFEMDGLTCKVTFHDPTYYDDFYTFRVLRGITVLGVPNYVTSSNYWPLSDRHDKRLRTLEGHVFPNTYFTTPGDVTYHQLIDTVCTEFDLGVVFADPAAAWLNYQFYPTGRTLVLNDAKQFFTILRQKFLVFATDYDEDVLFFYHAHNTAPAYPAGYVSVSAGHVTFPGHGSLKGKSFISRDENMTTHTSGGADKPLHNLGFLHSTASHPARSTFIDTNDWIMQAIPPNLKYLDFDAIRDTFDVGTLSLWPARFREVFNKKLSPSWQWQARFLDVFGNTEGGAIPSTIEAAAPYTPLNTSTFNKNLNTTHNNLQAMAEAVDELTTGPAIYGSTAKDPLVDADLFPIVDSETATHVVKTFTWANLKARLFAAFGLSLDAATAIYVPDDDDLLPVVDHSLAGKGTKAFSWLDLKNDVFNKFGYNLEFADNMTTPDDADYLPVEDHSSADNQLFHFSWANLKSRLKTYFDTLYVSHSLATAASDFLVASGAGAFVKKTLAQTLTILGKSIISWGMVSYGHVNVGTVNGVAVDFTGSHQHTSGFLILTASFGGGGGGGPGNYSSVAIYYYHLRRINSGNSQLTQIHKSFQGYNNANNLQMSLTEAASGTVNVVVDYYNTGDAIWYLDFIPLGHPDA